MPRSLLLGTERPGSGDASAAPLWKGCCGEKGAAESALKDLLVMVKKIAAMFAFGALATSAELYIVS